MGYMSLVFALLTAPAGLPPADLSGSVTDAAGKPVAQATVLVYTAKPRLGLGVLCPGCYLDCGKKATTDAGGKFLIPNLDPGLIFRILVVAEGLQPKFAADVDPTGGPLAVKLQTMPQDLSGRAVLRGRVLDPAGKPIVGAAVSPFGCKTADKQWLGRMPGVDPASVANLRGEFLITGNLGDLGYDLQVEARGFAKRNIDLLPTGEMVHEIRLGEGATVKGRILKDGKPVAAVAVGLAQCDRSAGHFLGPNRIATDGEGRYTFVNIHPNDDYFVYTAMSDAPGPGTVRRTVAQDGRGTLPVQRITVGGDGTTKDVGDGSLVPAHRVSGRLVLAGGKPVPASTRLLLSREEAWDTQSAVAAADGSFAFAGVPEEAVRLYVRIPGYRLDSKRIRFQQVGPGAIAIFIDADKSGIELFFEPDSTRPPTRAEKKSGG